MAAVVAAVTGNGWSCGDSDSDSTILSEVMEKVADLEMIGYTSFVRVFEKLR